MASFRQLTCFVNVVCYENEVNYSKKQPILSHLGDLAVSFLTLHFPVLLCDTVFILFQGEMQKEYISSSVLLVFHLT